MGVVIHIQELIASFKGTLKNQASNFQIERNDFIYSSKDAESKIEEKCHQWKFSQTQYFFSYF